MREKLVGSNIEQANGTCACGIDRALLIVKKACSINSENVQLHGFILKDVRNLMRVENN